MARVLDAERSEIADSSRAKQAGRGHARAAAPAWPGGNATICPKPISDQEAPAPCPYDRPVSPILACPTSITPALRTLIIDPATSPSRSLPKLYSVRTGVRRIT